MILIDEDKSIMAGDAKEILAELAATADRFFYEVEKETSGGISYDDLMSDFTRLIHKAKVLRKKGNVSPNDLIKEGMEATVFTRGPKSSSNKSSVDIDALLEGIANKKKKKKNKKRKD